jgi:site-specific DNA recombinase
VWAVAPDAKRRRTVQQQAELRLGADDAARIEFLTTEELIDALDAMREKQTLIETTEAELRKLEGEDERLYQLYLADELSKEDFGRRHRPLSARRTQLEEELPRLQAELDVMRIGSLSREETLSEAQGLAERWNDLALEDKRQIIESITERIVVGKEEVEIHLLQVTPVGNAADKATRPQGFCAATSCTLAG